jgi:alkanesulfonate monooxygenase SsuD/methylene tetrahydromethanopterin reductase-like flavin-dependent oxidoreductase (luciferase family)
VGSFGVHGRRVREVRRTSRAGLKVKEAYASGATVKKLQTVTEHMVKTYYAAGRPEEVRDQIIELLAAAGWVMITSPSPNSASGYEEAIGLLGRSSGIR